MRITKRDFEHIDDNQLCVWQGTADGEDAGGVAKRYGVEIYEGIYLTVTGEHQTEQEVYVMDKQTRSAIVIGRTKDLDEALIFTRGVIMTLHYMETMQHQWKRSGEIDALIRVGMFHTVFRDE